MREEHDHDLPPLITPDASDLALDTWLWCCSCWGSSFNCDSQSKLVRRGLGPRHVGGSCDWEGQLGASRRGRGLGSLVTNFIKWIF